ncbi:hypothetical protein [Streptomyces sp. NPDC002994]|uniref:hypothetical protein n=1 Tax=Streptomyces sp. NPDC002994 TaxID=3154441 RepID=UPI0033BE1385
MITQTTDPVQPDSIDVRRMNYMAALSLAETILSETTVIPTHFAVTCADVAPDEATLRFYFHRDAAAVARFADELYLDVTTTVQDDDGVFTEACGGLHRGVQVTAWSLMPASAVADTAQVSA